MTTGGGPDRLERLVAALAGHVDNVVAFRTIDSTHRVAIGLLEQMDHEGLPLAETAVVALGQSGGVGRGGRRWVSPEGGLYLDWVRSGLAEAVVPQLPMLAAAAAQLCLSRLGVHGVGIKWPNDLLVDGRKLAGVLVHVRHGERALVAVGLGVNVTEAPVLADPSSRRAIAIADFLEGESDDPFVDWAPRLAADFVASLTAAIEDPGPAVARWRQAVVHRPGDPMKVRLGSGAELDGRFAGLTAEGFLRLELPGGERTITGGDVL